MALPKLNNKRNMGCSFSLSAEEIQEFKTLMEELPTSLEGSAYDPASLLAVRKKLVVNNRSHNGVTPYKVYIQSYVGVSVVNYAFVDGDNRRRRVSYHGNLAPFLEDAYPCIASYMHSSRNALLVMATEVSQVILGRNLNLRDSTWKRLYEYMQFIQYMDVEMTTSLEDSLSSSFFMSDKFTILNKKRPTHNSLLLRLNTEGIKQLTGDETVLASRLPEAVGLLTRQSNIAPYMLKVAQTLTQTVS